MALPPMKKKGLATFVAKKVSVPTKAATVTQAIAKATEPAKSSKLAATMKQMADVVLAAPADKEGLDLDGHLADFRVKLDQMEKLLATPDVPVEEFKQGFQLLKRHLLDVPQLGAELDEKEIGVISGAAWTQVDQGMQKSIKDKGTKKAKKSKPAKYSMATSMKQPTDKAADDLDGLLF